MKPKDVFVVNGLERESLAESGVERQFRMVVLFLAFLGLGKRRAGRGGARDLRLGGFRFAGSLFDFSPELLVPLFKLTIAIVGNLQAVLGVASGLVRLIQDLAILFENLAIHLFELAETILNRALLARGGRGRLLRGFVGERSRRASKPSRQTDGRRASEGKRD